MNLNDITIIELNDNDITNKKIKNYMSFCGVWALYGIEKTSKNGNWQCLQVGQSKNIGLEISIDLKYLTQYDFDCSKKKYINQFGKIVFEYNRYPTVREQLYSHIRQKYHSLKFICISDEGDLYKRKNIEKYFAWMMQSLYWRNGGTYKKSKTNTFDELEKIKDDILLDIKLDEKSTKNIQEIIILCSRIN